MNKFIGFLNGKKAYIVAGLIAVLTILIGCFHIVVPEWIWILLGALGLGAIKASIPSTDVELTGIAQNLLANKWGKYLAPVLLAIGAGLTAAGIVIPEFVWTGLAALGLGSLRANIEVAKKSEPSGK